MPPEYLTRAEADKRFRELEASMSDMAVDNAKRDGKVDTVTTALAELKKMIADKTQQRLVIAMFIITNIVSVGLALFAKGN
jgi:hypothetical protein